VKANAKSGTQRPLGLNKIEVFIQKLADLDSDHGPGRVERDYSEKTDLLLVHTMRRVD
jgi:hypothetical protein